MKAVPSCYLNVILQSLVIQRLRFRSKCTTIATIKRNKSIVTTLFQRLDFMMKLKSLTKYGGIVSELTRYSDS